MMTAEEAQKKIIELETEIKRLKGLRNVPRENVPFLFVRENTDLENVDKCDCEALGKVLRKVVFAETKTRTNNTTFITYRQMTQRQYDFYMELFRRVIGVILDGRKEAVERKLNCWQVEEM